jgi:hypothetical protein
VLLNPQDWGFLLQSWGVAYSTFWLIHVPWIFVYKHYNILIPAQPLNLYGSIFQSLMDQVKYLMVGHMKCSIRLRRTPLKLDSQVRASILSSWVTDASKVWNIIFKFGDKLVALEPLADISIFFANISQGNKKDSLVERLLLWPLARIIELICLQLFKVPLMRKRLSLLLKRGTLKSRGQRGQS